MRLHLLRHAKSSWEDPTLRDIDRPLNERGERAARAIAAHLVEVGVELELIVSSPATRTRETIEPILAALDPAPRVVFEDRLYGAGPAELLASARRVPREVGAAMLVAHNPGIGALASVLAGERAEASGIAAKYPTGALASFAVEAESWSALEPERCELLDFVRPRELE